jgi:hypothetical protein
MKYGLDIFMTNKNDKVMKANAPKKIYLQEPTIVRTQKMYDNDIEYTRTDAFIERASEWLDNFYNEDTNSYLIDEDIESFIDYMEGE